MTTVDLEMLAIYDEFKYLSNKVHKEFHDPSEAWEKCEECTRSRNIIKWIDGLCDRTTEWYALMDIERAARNLRISATEVMVPDVVDLMDALSKLDTLRRGQTVRCLYVGDERIEFPRGNLPRTK